VLRRRRFSPFGRSEPTLALPACRQPVFQPDLRLNGFAAARCDSLISLNHSFSVGKYLVSPSSKRLDDGAYCASVSIRSGRGSASTDRVMRFTPRFKSERSACRYAREQGLILASRFAAPAAA
jgi:hypothetical protein